MTLSRVYTQIEIHESKLLELATLLADHATAIKELRELVKPAPQPPNNIRDNIIYGCGIRIVDQPVEADVPEKRYGYDVIKNIANRIFEIPLSCVGAPYEQAVVAILDGEWHAEISRRVADAVAAKDKRIAELEADEKRMNDLIVNVDFELAKIDNLLAEVVDWRNVDQKCVSGRVWGVRNLRQQLAASQAEVARLKGEIADLHEPPPNMNTGGPVVEVRIDDECPTNLQQTIMAVRGLIKDAIASGRIAEIDIADFRPLLAPLYYAMDAELTKLREENARLTGELKKHMECVAKALERSGNPDGYTINDFLVVWLDQEKAATTAERNAREAAEAERDELREACNKYATHIGLSKRGSDQYFYIMDGRGAEHASPADAVLAAFRAEKGTVPT